MNVLICHFGEPWQALVATSLMKGIPANFKEAKISWAIPKNHEPLFEYNSKIERLYLDYEPIEEHFNLAINLTPSVTAADYANRVDADVRLGFLSDNGAIICTGKDAEVSYRIMAGEETTDRNIFQVLYRLAGIKWRGEGYDLAYFPKTRTKKKKTGIAISNPDLRQFVKENLQLDMSEIWHIPLRQNLLKRIDELNRCKNIVTDDLFSLHAAIALRKHVEFLDIEGTTMAIEFFGNGNYHRLFCDDSDEQEDKV